MTGVLDTMFSCMFPGQRIIHGTRIPPSYKYPLLDLKGLFLNKEPLSDVNTTNVLDLFPG